MSIGIIATCGHIVSITEELKLHFRSFAKRRRTYGATNKPGAIPGGYHAATPINLSLLALALPPHAASNPVPGEEGEVAK